MATMASGTVVCDLCGDELHTVRVDGRTKFGPWADMCVTCHAEHGAGFGVGRGQKYDVQTGRKLEG